MTIHSLEIQDPGSTNFVRRTPRSGVKKSARKVRDLTYIFAKWPSYQGGKSRTWHRNGDEKREEKRIEKPQKALGRGRKDFPGVSLSLSLSLSLFLSRHPRPSSPAAFNVEETGTDSPFTNATAGVSHPPAGQQLSRECGYVWGITLTVEI